MKSMNYWFCWKRISWSHSITLAFSFEMKGQGLGNPCDTETRSQVRIVFLFPLLNKYRIIGTYLIFTVVGFTLIVLVWVVDVLHSGSGSIWTLCFCVGASHRLLQVAASAFWEGTSPSRVMCVCVFWSFVAENLQIKIELCKSRPTDHPSPSSFYSHL